MASRTSTSTRTRTRTKKGKPRGPFLHVEIDPELRHRARQVALSERMDLKDWVSEAIREKIRSAQTAAP